MTNPEMRSAREDANPGDYALVDDVLAVAVAAPGVSCGSCCFLPASGNVCRKAPNCSAPNVRFKKTPKTSDRYLLLRLKGLV